MRTIIPAVATVLLFSACTSTSPGTPSAVTTTVAPHPTTSPITSTKPASDLPSDGAPKVSTPVNATKFVTQPCRSFTDAQRTQLGLTAGEPDHAPLGEACRWRANGGGSTRLAFLDSNTRGLSATYKNNKAGAFKYFEPTSVSGQPAVLSSAIDLRDQGDCELAVGLTDELVYTVQLTQSPDKVGTADPCQIAVKVAGMALETIKAG